jgi:hypothetical protein
MEGGLTDACTGIRGGKKLFLIKSWLKSLHSPKDIAVKRFNTIGKTILYVFFLTLISIIPTSIYTSQDFYRAAHDFGEIVDTSLPTFQINEGILSSSETEPSIFVYNNTYILFDPTGKWSEAELEQYNQSIGFFKGEFSYHIAGNTQSLPYSMLNGIISSKDDLTQVVDTFLSILPILISLIILASYILSASIKFIEVSIIAFFGLSFSRLLNKDIPYRRLWFMSAYSITLAVTFLTIMDLLNIAVIFSYSVYWFVSLTMLYLAIREIPKKR